MPFTTEQFYPDRIANTGRLFSDEIEGDPWVMFHGTSGFNENSIERNGFVWNHNTISAEQLGRVAIVFEKMKWRGSGGGGYEILKPFSLSYDFQVPNASPVFFAESGVRALLYATRDFAGGEKLRSLRHAFRDLDKYLNEPQIRERHYEDMNNEYQDLLQKNANPSAIDAAQPIDVDLNWLKRELVNIADIRMLADDALRRHTHGVVYALRMTNADLESLRWNASMGIEAIAAIPPARIIGKVIVPPDYEMNQPGNRADDLLLRKRSCGLCVALCAAHQ